MVEGSALGPRWGLPQTLCMFALCALAVVRPLLLWHILDPPLLRITQYSVHFYSQLLYVRCARSGAIFSSTKIRGNLQW